jgi:hypothetical protein
MIMNPAPPEVLTVSQDMEFWMDSMREIPSCTRGKCLPVLSTTLIARILWLMLVDPRPATVETGVNLMSGGYAHSAQELQIQLPVSLKPNRQVQRGN